MAALLEQPGQSDLRRCGADLGVDGLHFVDDAGVLLEVALGEARVVLAPVVVGELLGGADRPGEEAYAGPRLRCLPLPSTTAATKRDRAGRCRVLGGNATRTARMDATHQTDVGCGSARRTS